MLTLSKTKLKSFNIPSKESIISLKHRKLFTCGKVELIKKSVDTTVAVPKCARLAGAPFKSKKTHPLVKLPL